MSTEHDFKVRQTSLALCAPQGYAVDNVTVVSNRVLKTLHSAPSHTVRETDQYPVVKGVRSGFTYFWITIRVLKMGRRLAHCYYNHRFGYLPLSNQNKVAKTMHDNSSLVLLNDIG